MPFFCTVNVKNRKIKLDQNPDNVSLNKHDSFFFLFSISVDQDPEKKTAINLSGFNNQLFLAFY